MHNLITSLKKKKKKRMHDLAHTTPSSLTKNQPLSDQLFH
jgi:hypothetical protein